jgi:predicted acetyltransferase
MSKDLDFKIVAEEDVDDNLDKTIKDLLCECFPESSGYFSKSRHWNDIRPVWNVLVFCGEEIIAGLVIIERKITVNSKDVLVAGIGNVCVSPSYRSQGISSKMISYAMQYAGQSGYDFGMLFCSKSIEGIYQKSGWYKINPEDVVKTNSKGQKEQFKELQKGSIVMLHNLAQRNFPDGVIYLNGMQW